MHLFKNNLTVLSPLYPLITIQDGKLFDNKYKEDGPGREGIPDQALNLP